MGFFKSACVEKRSKYSNITHVMKTIKCVLIILIILSLFISIRNVKANSLNDIKNDMAFKQMKEELSIEPNTFVQYLDRQIREWSLKTTFGLDGLSFKYINRLGSEVDPLQHPFKDTAGRTIETGLTNIQKLLFSNKITSLAITDFTFSVFGAGFTFIETLKTMAISTQILSPLYLNDWDLDGWSGKGSFPTRFGRVNFENAFKIDQSGLIKITQIQKINNDLTNYFHKVEISTPSTSHIERFMANIFPANIYDPETSTITSKTSLRHHSTIETTGGISDIKSSISWKQLPNNQFDSYSWNNPLSRNQFDSYSWYNHK
jgi:hypothetical protein